jgi:hypothetical protein
VIKTIVPLERVGRLFFESGLEQEPEQQLGRIHTKSGKPIQIISPVHAIHPASAGAISILAEKGYAAQE